MKKLIIVVCIIAALLVAVYFALPGVLRALGLHPNYADSQDYAFKSGRVLIITTSHDTLGEGEDAKSTGVYASELFIPYYEFLDAGLTVDIASMEGGEIPIEASSLKWPLKTASEKRYLKDDITQQKVENSLAIDDVDFTDYDMIFISGGWGASYDLGLSDVLGEGISQAYMNGEIIGTVCHGSLGLIKAVDENGELLIKGKTITGVTNKQITELGIEMTPMHPETELKAAGANYVSASAWRDIFANMVVEDGNLVTGQNQNASAEVAQRMMAQLEEKQGE